MEVRQEQDGEIGGGGLNQVFPLLLRRCYVRLIANEIEMLGAPTQKQREY